MYVLYRWWCMGRIIGSTSVRPEVLVAICLLPVPPVEFLSPHSCGICQCCCLPTSLIPPQCVRLPWWTSIAQPSLLVWVLLTFLKSISCSWISHVTVDKVLYSSGSVEHLLLYCRLAVYRWKHCESLTFFFFYM